jgi:[acyl-carrier-protein] S-malonyltransferase
MVSQQLWDLRPLRARCYRDGVSNPPRPPQRDDMVALFPGQGSLAGGAGRAWRESTHWDVVTRVSDVAGVDVAHLLLEADDDEVVRTDRAQIATFALSLVGWAELLERGVRPRYLLGHSLGEFSALVAAGLLDLEEGARLIAVRGAAMARAAAQSEGSMVALMGGEEGARDRLADLSEVWIANINGTGQIVVSGSRRGLDDLLARHRDLGWKRATPLAVGGAFHSPLMAPAQTELDAALEGVTWGETDATLIANVDGRVHTSAAEWRDLLSRQLTSPVEFLDATLALPEGVSTSVEMPPAGVPTGLTKRIRPYAAQFAPASPADFEEVPR